MKKLTRRLERRKRRVSSNILGASSKPRIAIFRSNKYIFAQAIDDNSEVTICSVTSKSHEGTNVTKSQAAFKAGESMARSMLDKDIKIAVIDRSRFTYLGRVSKFVEGVRSGGVKV